MNATEQQMYDMGYHSAQMDCEELADNQTVAIMRDAIERTIDRHTAEPDHPGNMKDNDLAMFYGRLTAYQEYLS